MMTNCVKTITNMNQFLNLMHDFKIIISHLTLRHWTYYQSLSLWVVISASLFTVSWIMRERAFHKTYTTSSLSFTLLAAVPPLPLLSVSLDVDNGIFCEQVTKTQRMCVCPPPYCHRLSGPESERWVWQNDSRTVFQPPIVTKLGSRTWCDFK